MTTIEETPSGNLPEFNRKGDDKMGLGHTPSTRSAELVAGARAVLMSNAEHNALSKISGRITASVISRIDGNTNVLWFFPARMIALETLTQRFAPADKPDLLLVDLASGFSPRGLHMAEQFPNATVIEIDLPDVVAEKKSRLTKGRIAVPDNLNWLEADLGKTDLSEVLDGRQADLITSEGLTLYLTQHENQRFFKQVATCLAPGGTFLVDIYFKDKIQHVRRSPHTNNAASLILRMVGAVPGLMPDKATAESYFTEAGLTQVQEFPLAAMMEELNHPKPLDVISIMAGAAPR